MSFYFKVNSFINNEGFFGVIISMSDKRFTINIEIVRKAFSDFGLILLETEYKNNHTPMKYICKCGKTDVKKWMNFNKGNTQCWECGVLERSGKLRKPFSDILSICEKKGFILITTETEYKDSFVKGKTFWIKVKCSNNHIISRNVNSLDAYDNKYGECRECFYENNTGENNVLFIDGRTKLNGKIRDNSMLSPWRRSIFLRDNFQCVICHQNSNTLRAHHLNGYNWDIKNRYNIDNGVTLCGKHHKDFHDIHGYGNNTREQFDSFKLSFL